MKILTAQQIRNVDQYTITHEPIQSIDLMERASEAFVAWFIVKFDPKHSITIVCGTGNNGGDGLAIARLLHKKHYKVRVYAIGELAKATDDFSINYKRLKDHVDIQWIENSDEISVSQGVIIDAIFGSGLSRPVQGLYADVISVINNADAIVVSVDIASGLFANEPLSSGAIVQPQFTVTFQLPKLAFMFPSNAQFVGDWVAVNIGLSRQGVEQQSTDYYYIGVAQAKKLVKSTLKFAHKGDNGRALIMSGSYGKMGAAVLSASAAIRSGVGLLTMYIPKCGYEIMQLAVPEAMALTDEGDKCLTSYADEAKYNAIGIGPGIGQEKETVYSVMQAVQSFDRPLVIDADGLNIMAVHREIFEILPENSIITPHPKEFMRLVGEWGDDYERLEKQKALAREYKIIVILKGAHTSIALPSGEVYFNGSGNEGMAKGGSGDVLTGVVTSLLAQQYTPKDAAILGVYLHGKAGDIAKKYKGTIGMVASDIVNYLPDAYSEIVNT